MKSYLCLLMFLLFAASIAAQTNQRLTRQEQRALIQQVCKDYGKMREHDDEMQEDCRRGRLEKIIKATAFARIDLDGDAQPEYRLSITTPGARLANSIETDFYIYQKMPQGYNLLFSETAYSLAVRKTMTHGYRDLFSENHGAESSFTVYKYDGKRYQEADCWREERDRRGRTVRKKC